MLLRGGFQKRPERQRNVEIVYVIQGRKKFMEEVELKVNAS